jgi:hypothetical protein
MAIQVEDLDDQSKYRHLLTIPYQDLIQFVLGYLKKRSGLTFCFWLVCLFFLGLTVFARIKISGSFPENDIILHSVLGLIIFPVLCIPVHELIHVIPYYISGARNIRVGMDLKQYLFYVTAHRYVATPIKFIIVAIAPFLIISTSITFLAFLLPGLWIWSFSLFLFAHSTMCAGDFALLNFYFLNRDKKIYTWDDADQKIAYFYEKLEERGGDWEMVRKGEFEHK